MAVSNVKEIIEAVRDTPKEEIVYNREKIWWIASYPKSGNTWTRIFLSSYARGGFVSINFMGQTFQGDLHPYFYQSVSPRPLDQLERNEIIGIRPAALLHMCCLYNSAECPLLIKTHCFYDKNNYLIPDFLSNGAIYLIRDPRDIAVSYAKHNSTTIDDVIDHLGQEKLVLVEKPLPLFQATGSWSANVSSWTDINKPLPRLVLRYEDMLSDPKACFGDMVKFIGFDYDEEVLERTIAGTTIEKLRAQEDKVGFIERKGGDRFFNNGKAGGWKDVLTNKQREKIEADHGDVMKQFGYL